MRVTEILKKVKTTAGSNAKKDILQEHSENETLKSVLRYGLDPFVPFNIVKIPRTKARIDPPGGTEPERFETFFSLANACAVRELSGNDAIRAMEGVFASCTQDEEAWMRKILKKHLSIGASTKTVNKVFPGLIPTFEVALAQKFEKKRIEGKRVCVEPKLDGIRCFAIVEHGDALLYARSGKLITNFDSTIGAELANLPDGCYDGEIMGEDFIALMRQAYRKDNVITEGTYLALFDYLPMEEWNSRDTKMTCDDRHSELVTRVGNQQVKYLRVISRFEIDYTGRSASDYEKIKALHDEFVRDGFEGAMVKNLDAPYKFGRGHGVMKLKAFHDVDLKIERLLEGTGKHVGKLGSVAVDYQGVEVQVGSGFSDELRESIWSDPDNFVGRMIEVRYQEVTPDGSLRFPTFVCFRNDR
jgi:DNA ligase-1